MGISIKRVSDEMLSFLQKNRIILDYPSVKSRDNRVNLHYYFADEGLAEKNLGDYLSIVVVDWMLRKEGMSLDTCIQGKKHLYAIGSIILMGYQNCTIWGTGFPFAPSLLRGLPHRYPFRKLDVRSVRGPRTRDVMLALGHSAPKIYGDPAILMPYIYTPTYREKKTDYVVIPHFST
jgi:pyruvyltransferase